MIFRYCKPLELWGPTRVSGLLAVTAGLLVAALVAGCGGGGGSGGPTPSAQTATVTGTIVHDGRLDGVADATARIESRSSAATSATGEFTITQVPTGPQELQVSQQYYLTLTTPITVGAPSTDAGIIYLVPKMTATQGAVSGVVVNSGTNDKVAGALISIADQTGKSRSDGTGVFHVYKIPVQGASQTYTIWVYDPATGRTGSKQVTVTAGPTPADAGTIALEFGPPPPPW